VDGGHLLLLRERGLTLAASSDETAIDDSVMSVAQEKIRAALGEGDMTTRLATVIEELDRTTPDGVLVEIGGEVHFPVIVATESAGALRIVGLAFLAG